MNALIDDLLVTADRLLQLPLVVILGALAVGTLGVALATGRFLKKWGKVALHARSA